MMLLLLLLLLMMMIMMMMMVVWLNVRMNNTDDYDIAPVNAAERIVSGFADNAPLSLTDVFRDYTQHANAIQQSFTSRHRTSVLFIRCVLIRLATVVVLVSSTALLLTKTQ